MTCCHRLALILATPALLIMAPMASLASDDELWESHSVMEGGAFGRMDLGTRRECRDTRWLEAPEIKIPGGGRRMQVTPGRKTRQRL